MIDNDLAVVDAAIRDFWSLPPLPPIETPGGQDHED